MFPPKKSAKPFLPKKSAPGLGSPPPIGGPAPEPDADDMGGPPDNDADDQGVAPSPEALHYHSGPQPCSECEYMNGQQCAVLKIEVAPDDGCVAWSPKDQGGPGGPGNSPDMSPDVQPYPS